jgi:hypothetical protein
MVLTVVHKSSDGIVMFMPDVCKTPAPPAPPIPIPYPNIAMSQDTAGGSTTVKVDGNPIMLQGSNFSKSSGDEAGSLGGVVSGLNKGKAEFISYAFDVQVEGKNVPRLMDMMLGNIGGAPNTPPMPLMQPPIVVVAMDLTEEESDSITIVLKDRGGKPIKDEKYVLELRDGKKQEGKTDGSGKVKVDKTVSGAGRVRFPDLEGTVKPGE